MLELSIYSTIAQEVSVGKTLNIHSDVLKEDRQYRIALPESYAWATDRRYPVIYVLDGESQFLHTSASLKYLAAQREIPELIVVGIDSTIRIRDYSPTDWSEVWVGGGGAGAFKKFIATELLPTIEQKYRTDGFRILSGSSAGGLFAIYCVTTDHSLFQAYLALTPSLDWDHNWPQRELEKTLKSHKDVNAFLYVARSDDTGRALEDFEKLVDTLKINSPKQFRWSSRAFPEETHSAVPLLAQIDGIRQVYQGYRFHSDLVSKGLPYAEKHFDDVSKRVGWRLEIPESVINEFAYEALSQGKTEEAITLFKRNVENNSNSANAYDGLADGLAKAGQWKEAVQASEKALSLAVQYSHPKQAYFLRQERKMKDRLKQTSGQSK
ncbi:MAG: alpha/beta hydrolase-fold protein [Pirellulales bacterium]